MTEAANKLHDVSVQVDRPRIGQALAWKRGEAVFDDVPLSKAVAEMNRYSRRPIVLVGDASVARRRVIGLFRTGDNWALRMRLPHGIGWRCANEKGAWN